MKLLLHNQDLLYEVLLDESTGKQYIDVVCGTSAWYTQLVELTTEEREAFANASTALDGLARNIVRNPSRYLDRVAQVTEDGVVVKRDASQ